MKKMIDIATIKDLLTFLEGVEGKITESSTRDDLIERLNRCLQPDYAIVITEYDNSRLVSRYEENFKKDELLRFIDSEISIKFEDIGFGLSDLNSIRLKIVNDETYPYFEKDNFVVEIFKYY